MNGKDYIFSSEPRRDEERDNLTQNTAVVDYRILHLAFRSKGS